MYPGIFPIVSGDAGVRAVLGAAPVRVFPFGAAPDNVDLPYAVWQTIDGGPENYLGNLPDLDTFIVQVDVYATTATSARAAARALRDAIEPHAHITAWRGESTDPETGDYRYTFEANILTTR